MRQITIKQNGHVWRVPLEAVADHRARYYAQRDPDTTYQQEYDYVMEDEYEGLDWFQNNMDFSDIADKATLTAAHIPSEPDMGEEHEITIEDK